MEAMVALSSELDAGTQRLGTRFLVFPQPPFIPGYERPEIVWVPEPPGSIKGGPSDSRIYVVDPLPGKPPYGFPFLPPCPTACHPPAEPGPDGHFDHYPVDSREFLAAHVYACVRRVLDICENYLGKEIGWFFASRQRRLEIVPRIAWDNAQSGFGFLEMGEDYSRDPPVPFALNFDAIAHETGHLVLLSTLGLPISGPPTLDFLAYHEAVADFISMMGLLHFDSALDKILRRTRGNLLIMNELDRFAELADEKQIRVLSHSLRMRDVGKEVHDFSKPFAGALFDTLVDAFEMLLVERGLSSPDLLDVEDVRADLTQRDIDHLLSGTQEGYELHHFAIKSALIDARDIVGEILARSWTLQSPEQMDIRAAAATLVDAAEQGRMAQLADRVRQNLRWRELL